MFPSNAGIYILDNASAILENNTITNTDRVGVDVELTPTLTYITTSGNVEDTVNVAAQEELQIAVSFDERPGMWMYHCHILDHAEVGMMGQLHVAE